MQTNGRGQEYVKARELSGGTRSSCRAIFFRNTHETTGEKIVSLKIARLNKSNGLLTEKQNKSVTLNSDELDKLIEYIQNPKPTCFFQTKFASKILISPEQWHSQIL